MIERLTEHPGRLKLQTEYFMMYSQQGPFSARRLRWRCAPDSLKGSGRSWGNARNVVRHNSSMFRARSSPDEPSQLLLSHVIKNGRCKQTKQLNFCLTPVPHTFLGIDWLLWLALSCAYMRRPCLHLFEARAVCASRVPKAGSQTRGPHVACEDVLCDPYCCLGILKTFTLLSWFTGV